MGTCITAVTVAIIIGIQNGQTFQLGLFFPQVHFVHYNTKYSNLSASVSKKDGLAVLAVFFQVFTSSLFY